MGAQVVSRGVRGARDDKRGRVWDSVAILETLRGSVALYDVLIGLDRVTGWPIAA